MEGGTVELGDPSRASLSVTYKYAPFFREQLDTEQGIRWLYGKTGAQCLDRLEQAVQVLGTKASGSYWNATAGNAGAALAVLLKWAKQHPDAVFQGD